MKLVKCIPEFYFFTVFMENRNIISKIKRSKVTDYAALMIGDVHLLFIAHFMNIFSFLWVDLLLILVLVLQQNFLNC